MESGSSIGMEDEDLDGCLDGSKGSANSNNDLTGSDRGDTGRESTSGIPERTVIGTASASSAESGLGNFETSYRVMSSPHSLSNDLDGASGLLENDASRIQTSQINSSTGNRDAGNTGNTHAVSVQSWSADRQQCDEVDADRQQTKGATVKCAGCAKVFSQPCGLPQRANRIVLSLCDDCENITSALFVCITCGQECISLAALRAHKQTHISQYQRAHICEMCGVSFSSPLDLEVHKCALMNSGCIESETRTSNQNRTEVAIEGERPRNKPKLSQKVRVEEIVSTLTKRTQTIVKVARRSADAPTSRKFPRRAQKQSETVKPSRSSARKKSTTKTFQVSKSGQVPTVLKTATSTRTRRVPAIKLADKTSVIRIKPQKRNLKPPKVFECLHCSEFFTESKELRKHKLTHNTKETFSCETCQKLFKSKGNLKRHELSHLGVQDNICDVCNKNFQSPQTLFTHKNTVHNEDKPFVCDICKKAFKQLGNMKTHRRTHTGERPFICKQCGRAFAQMGNLQAHMVIHADSKPHVCDTCGKSFSYLRSLQNHMRGTHTGERPFPCNTCGKTFSNPSVLRDHRRTHSEKRGYLCDKCGKGFKSYKNLKQHEKFHLDVRPYNCDVCGKGFVWFKSFQLHKRTHTGEKPYSCDQCEKVFSNINSLKNHKQKHLVGHQVPAKAPAKVVVPAPPVVTPSPSMQASASPLSLANNQTVFLSNAGMYSRVTHDHEANPGHLLAQPQVPPTSPADTPSLHQPLPPHTQAYGHVVFSQPFSTYVTSAGGDFTIL